MKKHYLIYLFAVLLIGCRQQALEEGKIIDFGEITDIKLSETISEYHIIQLETTDESLFGNLDMLNIIGNEIYVLDTDTNSGVYVFSKEGIFLRKLDNRGRGPGEFIVASSFAFDKNDNIYILDNAVGKVMTYDIKSFEYKRDVQLPNTGGYPYSFSVSDDGKYFYYYSSINLNNPERRQNFMVADIMGKIINRDVSVPSNSYIYGTQQLFYKFDNDLFGYPIFSNKVYRFDKGDISEQYIFNFGQNKFPDQEFFYKNNSSTMYSELIKEKYIKSMTVVESSTHILVRYDIAERKYWGIYDKRDESTKSVRVDNIE